MAQKCRFSQALNASKITEDDIDTAISRIFTHFIALGELEGPEDVIFQVRKPISQPCFV